MPAFSTDADLLKWEPALMREVVLEGQELTRGTGATTSGLEVTADGQFLTRGVRPGHVIHLANPDEGLDGFWEVVSVETEGLLVATVVGRPPDDLVPLPAAADLDFAVQTFDPQHEEARWAILARFGLEMDAADPASDLERWVVGERVFRRTSVAWVLATLYRGQAAGGDVGLGRKADHYADLYERELAKARVHLDRSGDGLPDDLRTQASFRLRRD